MSFGIFFPLHLIVSIVLTVVDGITGSLNAATGWVLLIGLYALAVLIPSIALSVHRLHDTNRSGWWIRIGLIPLVGQLS